jgi:hypothetical protein
LILAVITQWGSQYRLIHSIYRSKDAFCAYAIEADRNDNNLKATAVAIIRSSTFWANLDVLKDVLESIDGLICMSESGRSHFGLIVGQWIQVNNIIERYNTTIPALQSFKINQFLPRFHREVNDMHWAAHFLMPKHATSKYHARTPTIYV